MSSKRGRLGGFKLSEVANILGVLGIIGSLIFVGVEMKQSHTIAMAAQIQDKLVELLERIVLHNSQFQNEKNL